MEEFVFSEWLKEELKKQKMTQKMLAERAMISEAAVSHYIKGNRVPSFPIMIHVLHVLGKKFEIIDKDGKADE